MRYFKESLNTNRLYKRPSDEVTISKSSKTLITINIKLTKDY